MTLKHIVGTPITSIKRTCQDEEFLCVPMFCRCVFRVHVCVAKTQVRSGTKEYVRQELSVSSAFVARLCDLCRIVVPG